MLYENTKWNFFVIVPLNIAAQFPVHITAQDLYFRREYMGFKTPEKARTLLKSASHNVYLIAVQHGPTAIHLL